MANLQIVPAGKNVEAQYVEMKVPLYSYGCEKKVKKALSHRRGMRPALLLFAPKSKNITRCWTCCNHASRDPLGACRL